MLNFLFDVRLLSCLCFLKLRVFTAQPCGGIVFTHGVWMGEWAGWQAVGGKNLSGLYLRNRKV